jgi:hypothetical protein
MGKTQAIVTSVYAHTRLVRIAAGAASLAAALSVAGCQVFRPGLTGRPTAEQVAAALPAGTTVEAVQFADLDGDGRDEMLAQAKLAEKTDRVPAAFVFTRDGRRYAQVFQRRLIGDAWLPIQFGRPGEGAPLVAVFATRGGDQALLRYVLVRHNGRKVVSVLDNNGVFQGGVRFVPEGLLESSGDTDRILRLGGDGQWQVEELDSQYARDLPPGTIKVDYFVDPVRGPMVDTPVREVRLQIGQRLVLHRTDRAAPSRIRYVGVAGVYEIGLDGSILARQPGVFEIHIEGPAYSGRVFSIVVRVDP